MQQVHCGESWSGSGIKGRRGIRWVDVQDGKQRKEKQGYTVGERMDLLAAGLIMIVVYLDQPVCQ